MPINQKYNAAHILRLWVWNVLDANTTMDKITVSIKGETTEVIPVAPLSDSPLLADTGKTYIIYGHVEQDPTDGYLRNGTIAYRILARDYNELVEISNVISDLFELPDVAAANINRWSSTVPALIGVHFTSCWLSYVEIGDPEATEGGPVEGVVSIRYRYLRQPATITLPA